jgi:hypothetical protein
MKPNPPALALLFSALPLLAGCVELLQNKPTINEERRAKAEKAVQSQIEALAKRPVEPWEASQAREYLLEATWAVTAVDFDDAAPGAKQAYQISQLGRLQQAWQDYFARAHKTAMSGGDPELAQGLTATQFQLQEAFWDTSLVDLLARFREEAGAVALYRQELFEKRKEYAKLNEATCIASDQPLEPPDQHQPNLHWHFKRPSELHVRCLFPTTIKSQVAGALSYTVEGAVYFSGTKDKDEGDRRMRTELHVPVEVQRFADGRYFDFAFDLAESTKGMKWGYMRIEGDVGWTTAAGSEGVEKHENAAFIRASFE